SVDAVEGRLTAKGKTVTGKFALINGLTTSMSAQEAAAVAESSDVEGVSEDAVVKANAQSGELSLNSAAGIALGRMSDYTGAGIGVAIVDSGIDDTPELRSRITAFYDFTKGDIKKSPPKDEYGHGTFVAGVIGAAGKETRGEYSGIAPGVR